MNRRLLPRLLLTPAMATLFLWMIVPLVMTIYFSLIRYNLMQPDVTGFAGLENFEYFVTDASFTTSSFFTSTAPTNPSTRMKKNVANAARSTRRVPWTFGWIISACGFFAQCRNTAAT